MSHNLRKGFALGLGESDQVGIIHEKESGKNHHGSHHCCAETSNHTQFVHHVDSGYAHI
jgi:hypothetical protein